MESDVKRINLPDKSGKYLFNGYLFVTPLAKKKMGDGVLFEIYEDLKKNARNGNDGFQIYSVPNFARLDLKKTILLATDHLSIEEKGKGHNEGDNWVLIMLFEEYGKEFTSIYKLTKGEYGIICKLKKDVNFKPPY